MEWDDGEDDYYDSQYAGVGAPSQVLLTPQADYSSMGSFSQGLPMPSADTQAHDIADDHLERVALEDFTIPTGTHYQGNTATDRGSLEPRDTEWASFTNRIAMVKRVLGDALPPTHVKAIVAPRLDRAARQIG